MRYPIVIEIGNESTAYGVVVADLPGCFTAGDDMDEAISNAVDAIALWVEDAIENGQNVPCPSPLEALKMKEEYQGEKLGMGGASVDPTLCDEKVERSAAARGCH